MRTSVLIAPVTLGDGRVAVVAGFKDEGRKHKQQAGSRSEKSSGQCLAKSRTGAEAKSRTGSLPGNYSLAPKTISSQLGTWARAPFRAAAAGLAGFGAVGSLEPGTALGAANGMSAGRPSGDDVTGATCDRVATGLAGRADGAAPDTVGATASPAGDEALGAAGALPEDAVEPALGETRRLSAPSTGIAKVSVFSACH